MGGYCNVHRLRCGLYGEESIMETAIPVSKRSITGYGAMYLIIKLNESTSDYVIWAMGFVTLLAVAYMVFEEIKRRQNGTH